jgi:hypothetical protein
VNEAQVSIVIRYRRRYRQPISVRIIFSPPSRLRYGAARPLRSQRPHPGH